MNTHTCCGVIHAHYNEAVEGCEIAIHIDAGLIPSFQRGGSGAGAGDIVLFRCVLSRDTNDLFHITFRQHRWACIIDRLLITLPNIQNGRFDVRHLRRGRRGRLLTTEGNIAADEADSAGDNPDFVEPILPPR